MNEGRVFSNDQVLEKLKELDVQLIKVDFTANKKDMPENTELARANRKNIPVNLIYPPSYPEQPAILLNEVVHPGDVIFALDYLAKQTKEEAAKSADSMP